MKAIILAAGMGQRLGSASAGQPKCLLRFNGKSLLERHIELLNENRIKEIIIIAGYRHDAIEKTLRNIGSDAPVELLINDRYEQGSIISLHCASTHLLAGEDTLIMDADVLYDAKILIRLFNTTVQNCFLLDRDFESGDEPVKLCLADGRIVEFRKTADEQLHYDYQGESVGFFRFGPEVSVELANQTQQYIDSGRLQAPYEEAIRDLLLKDPGLFGVEEITGHPWIEIDFPGDVIRAEKEILTKIDH